MESFQPVLSICSGDKLKLEKTTKIYFSTFINVSQADPSVISTEHTLIVQKTTFIDCSASKYCMLTNSNADINETSAFNLECGFIYASDLSTIQYSSVYNASSNNELFSITLNEDKNKINVTDSTSTSSIFISCGGLSYIQIENTNGDIGYDFQALNETSASYFNIVNSQFKTGFLMTNNYSFAISYVVICDNCNFETTLSTQSTANLAHWYTDKTFSFEGDVNKEDIQENLQEVALLPLDLDFQSRSTFNYVIPIDPPGFWYLPVWAIVLIAFGACFVLGGILICLWMYIRHKRNSQVINDPLMKY